MTHTITILGSTGSIGTEPNRRVVVHYERSGGRSSSGYSNHERQ